MGSVLVYEKAIETQAKDGVDLRFMKNQGRTTWVVSRGGGLLAAWMIYHNRENLLLERFDDILDI